MKKYKLLSLFIVSVTVLTSSCQKEGPQGPAGPQGTTGPVGQQGATGPAGTTNVIYSSWQLSGSSNWIFNSFTLSGSQDAVYMYNRPASGITSTVISQGMVICFMRNTGGPIGLQTSYVAQLPYTYISGNTVDHYDFTIPPAGGQIYFLYKNTISPLTTSALGFIEYRYVIIPGSIPGGRMKDPRAMTYHELCRTYGIPE
jgi:hypothetical protein